jgi:hypothetical protein
MFKAVHFPGDLFFGIVRSWYGGHGVSLISPRHILYIGSERDQPVRKRCHHAHEYERHLHDPFRNPERGAVAVPVQPDSFRVGYGHASTRSAHMRPVLKLSWSKAALPRLEPLIIRGFTYGRNTGKEDYQNHRFEFIPL